MQMEFVHEERTCDVAKLKCSYRQRLTDNNQLLFKQGIRFRP